MNKLTRRAEPRALFALKAATRHALEIAGGGERFAWVTRVNPPALSKYADALGDAFMPLDVAADLDREIGSPVMAEALAASAGYRLVPVDTKAAAAPSLADVAKIMRESCDVADVLTSALADGRIVPAEARAIDREIEEAIAVLRGMQARVRLAGSGGQ